MVRIQVMRMVNGKYRCEKPARIQAHESFDGIRSREPADVRVFLGWIRVVGKSCPPSNPTA